MTGPTGRRRLRLHKPWFGKPVLVLQIEVVAGSFYNCGPSIEYEEYNQWRDARVEDLKLGEAVSFIEGN